MNCTTLPSPFTEFKIRFMSWDISKLNGIYFETASKILEKVKHISQGSEIIKLLNVLDNETYKWVLAEYYQRPLNQDGFLQILKTRMSREQAKKIKSDFVNMSQSYNGYEITNMWNMMCDQLFDQLEN